MISRHIFELERTGKKRATSDKVRALMPSMTTRMLRPQYQDRESCKWAAKGTVAGVAADLADNIVPSSTLTSFVDGATGVAVLKCAGFSRKQIVAYYLGLLLLAVILFLTYAYALPSSLFNECRVCKKRTNKRCTEYRDGTAAECTGVRLGVGALVSLVIVILAHRIVIFRYKARIFTWKSLLMSSFLRFLF